MVLTLWIMSKGSVVNLPQQDGGPVGPGNHGSVFLALVCSISLLPGTPILRC
jgi:hypothetical protein